MRHESFNVLPLTLLACALGLSLSLGFWVSTYTQANIPIVKWQSKTDVSLPRPGGFTLVPSKTSIQIYWKMASVSILHKVVLVRAENGFAMHPDVGEIVYEGTASSALDENVVEGKKYYYSIFSLDAQGRLSFPTRLTGIAQESVPPDVPLGFKVETLNGQVLVSWQNPKDSDFEQVVLSRVSTARVKSSPATSIYVGLQTRYLDGDIEPGTSYYYTIRAMDKSGLASKLLIATILPQPESIFKKIIRLSVVPGDKTNRLSWQLPSVSPYKKVIIFRMEDLVFDSDRNSTQIYAGTDNAFIDVSLKNGKVYYYGLVGLDEEKKMSVVSIQSGVPRPLYSTLSAQR
jgi:hypothetical protein